MLRPSAYILEPLAGRFGGSTPLQSSFVGQAFSALGRELAKRLSIGAPTPDVATRTPTSGNRPPDDALGAAMRGSGPRATAVRARSSLQPGALHPRRTSGISTMIKDIILLSASSCRTGRSRDIGQVERYWMSRPAATLARSPRGSNAHETEIAFNPTICAVGSKAIFVKLGTPARTPRFIRSRRCHR